MFKVSNKNLRLICRYNQSKIFYVILVSFTVDIERVIHCVDIVLVEHIFLRWLDNIDRGIFRTSANI